MYAMWRRMDWCSMPRMSTLCVILSYKGSGQHGDLIIYDDVDLSMPVRGHEEHLWQYLVYGHVVE